MTDKYEEFKEWFRKQPNILQIITSIESNGFETKAETEDIFEVFEKEREQEKEIQKKIGEIVHKNVSHHLITNNGLCVDAEAIYNELKEEGYLK